MYEFMMQLCQTSLVMTGVGLLFCLFRKLLGERYSAAGKRLTWLILFAGFLLVVKPVMGGSYLYDMSRTLTGSNVRASVYGQGASVREIYIGFRVAAALWLVGAAASLSLQLARHKEFMDRADRLAAEYAAAEKSALRERWSSCLRQCKVQRDIPLTVVPGLPSPMVVGLLHPRLLLPAEEMDADRLRLVLLHEASHVKAGDLWAKAFCQLAMAVHWFNPVIYQFGRLFELDMESACDERVLRLVGQDHRKQYCAAILSVVRSQMGWQTAFSTHFAVAPSQLKRRLTTIMSAKRRRMFAGVGAFVLVFTLCSGSALSLDVFGFTPSSGWETEATTSPGPWNPSPFLETQETWFQVTEDEGSRAIETSMEGSRTAQATIEISRANETVVIVEP